MVDTGSGIGRLPPAERLKRLRELEDEKRKTLDEEVTRKKKELDEELTKKKRELDELERKTKQELVETKKLEEETLEELEEKGQEQLEERLAAFRKGQEFLPEEPAEPPLTYHATLRGEPPSDLYHSPAFRQAESGIDYLLHAEGASEERRFEHERSLYQNVRWMQEQLAQGRIEEGYAVQRLQEQVHALKEGRKDEFGYLTRIENVLNRIVDYRQEDEQRRKKG